MLAASQNDPTSTTKKERAMSIANQLGALLRSLTLSTLISLALCIILIAVVVMVFVKYPWYLALSGFSLIALYFLTRNDLKEPPFPEDEDTAE
jgi:uncharacterized membrane protein